MGILDNITFGDSASVASAADGLQNGLSAYLLPADQAEASAVAWSVPSVLPDSSGGSTVVPWWQGVMQYGLTRAIDNQFGAPQVSGNVSPGSFAGQDGRTYDQTGRPTQSRTTAVRALDAGSGGGLGLLLLAGIAFAVVQGGD